MGFVSALSCLGAQAKKEADPSNIKVHDETKNLFVGCKCIDSFIECLQ
jgi:hypothetical protein